MIIDFHAHILPGVDHGSASLENSIKQLSAAKLAGIEVVVATSHFYPDKNEMESFLEKRSDAYEILKPSLKQFEITCILGAEVALCEGLENLKDLQKLCIEGTPYMLLEMPFRHITDRLVNTVVAIQEMGIKPILAHINRYSIKNVWRLLELGVLAQLNVEAFAGFRNRHKYISYIDKGMIHVLGSDSHIDRMESYPQFAKALKKLGQSRVENLMQQAAELLNLS